MTTGEERREERREEHREGRREENREERRESSRGRSWELHDFSRVISRSCSRRISRFNPRRSLDLVPAVFHDSLHAVRLTPT